MVFSWIFVNWAGGPTLNVALVMVFAGFPLFPLFVLGIVTMFPPTLTGVGVPGEVGLIASNCVPAAPMNLKFGTVDTCANDAVMLESTFNVTGQVPVPEQAVALPVPPLHPLNPALEVESVTRVPLSKTAEQVGAHAMPPGLEETEPVPSRTTDNVGRLKLAVMAELFVKAKLQREFADPLHVAALPVPLPQPLKFETPFVVACSVRLVPAL